ncbi:PREDICTED: putative disease resistance RPP13-like protein 1 [Fragaria vesca subsp. vesca]|uniref:putative disease resistance RPP13-like protein 1 n=1 Tax=Fragaria vesca subsp. vesca TaxID=101020 RepID=UPI0002C362F3|nr:PREDICTED: putative disease resistance RPP13-like protein 1 [Fragaria vesca subsp. vesca]
MLILEILSVVLGTGITSAFLPDVAKKLVQVDRKLRARDPEIYQKLQQLERRLLKIQSHVDDAENKASISNAYQIIIEDFKNVLLDADDLLDKTLLEYERICSQQLRPAKLEKHLKTFEGKLGKEIGEMVDTVNGLAFEMEGCTISELSQPTLAQTFSAPPHIIRGSLVDELSVVGREKDKQHILELVYKQNNTAVSVISIVGMIGIGKTTLAQLVFNDQNVVKEFTANRMWWVSVSFGDDVLKITKSICESTAKTVPDSSIAQLSSLDSVQLKLKEIVGEKEKFLLVLDGMCDENPINWDALKLPFRSAAPGSIIVVTTRSQVVSSIVADHSSTYCLGVLSDKHCFEIINTGLISSLSEKSGLQIAEKCKGVPLVAKLIPSVMRLKSKEMEWDEILRCELWNLAEDNNMIYPVLKRGYDQLPAYLKRCFAYSSLLPRNRPFQRDDLIQLWAAEGFIQARGTRRIEDIGREYFDDLCSRSFFQVSSENPSKGKYEMHGFIHDLAKIVSTNLCFACEGTRPYVLPVSTNVRHSSICDEEVESGMLEEFYRYRKLRTFMLLSKSPDKLQSVPDDFFRKFPCLRVLNLSGTRISKLSGDIKMLRHLRHLNVSRTLIIKFPQDIDQLRGLERLNVKNCSNLEELPENLNKLIKLRHIDLDKLGRVSSMPVDVGKLTSLETLAVFVVGSERGTTIEELKEMTCLRGSICIRKLEKVKNDEEAKAAKLQEKQYLEELELHWEPKRTGTDDQTVLEGLEPHPSLLKLQVMGYCGSRFPDWMSNPLFSKLVTINLRNCGCCILLPSLGGLPLIKHLVIEEMKSLKKVDDRFFHSDGRLRQVGFPSLETLKFGELLALNTWEGLEESDMPRLRKLTIIACKEFRKLPPLYNLAALKELEVDGCPELRSLEGGLPKSLKKLIILDSDKLKQRYCTTNVRDWSKISHVRHIETDDGIIQS